MRDAHYAVIRYVADPARNEPLNVGVVAWSDDAAGLRLDADAVARVVRENPRLETDALLHLEDQLRADLKNAISDLGPAVLLESDRGYPVSFSEARHTVVKDATRIALDETVERLLERIVRPRRRTGGPRGANPVDVLARQFKPLISSGQIQQRYFFEKSLTGLSRPFDFFANSGANLALDVLRLSVKRADEIRHRADAEAFKISDVSEKNPDVRFLVYCEVPTDPEMHLTVNGAKKILSSGGRAQVTTQLDEARAAMQRATRLA